MVTERFGLKSYIAKYRHAVRNKLYVNILLDCLQIMYGKAIFLVKFTSRTTVISAFNAPVANWIVCCVSSMHSNELFVLWELSNCSLFVAQVFEKV